MATFTFPSIKSRNEIAYRFHEDAMDLWKLWYHTPGAVACWAGKYHTCGDGLIQHGPESPILVGDLIDYLYSVSKAALEDKSVANALYYRWPTGPNSDLLDFLSRIEPVAVDENGYVIGKKRWYSPELRRVTTSPSAAHDRRYFQVPRGDAFEKGGAKFVLALVDEAKLPRESTDQFERMVWLDAIRAHAAMANNYDGEAWWLAWGLDSQITSALWTAKKIVDGFNKISSARSAVESYRRDLEYDAKLAAEKKNAVEAA